MRLDLTPAQFWRLYDAAVLGGLAEPDRQILRDAAVARTTVAQSRAISCSSTTNEAAKQEIRTPARATTATDAPQSSDVAASAPVHSIARTADEPRAEANDSGMLDVARPKTTATTATTATARRADGEPPDGKRTAAERGWKPWATGYAGATDDVLAAVRAGHETVGEIARWTLRSAMTVMAPLRALVEAGTIEGEGERPRRYRAPSPTGPEDD